MKKKKDRQIDLPNHSDIVLELERVKYKRKYYQVVRNTIFTLITVSAVSVLVATLLLPVLQIYGGSMSPTLAEGDIVVSLKQSRLGRGDIIAFYYNNKILCKRIIGTSGDVIDIDDEGSVTVNGVPLSEDYLSNKEFGDCNIELPYQVPESKYFVMGDQRSISIDSRNTALGCISDEQIVGKIVFRVWPINQFGKVIEG